VDTRHCAASRARTESQAWASRKTARSTLLRHRARDESGQAAVEFGLVVPFVCLLVWALLQFGLALNYYLDVTHLANEGARLAAVVGNSAQPSGDLKAWIQQQAETTELRDGTGSVTAPAQVCVTFLTGPTGTKGQIGDPVQVTVSAPYKWIPFIGGGTLTIRSSSVMRLEQLPTYSEGCYQP
jgi:Flp pilus assembly protein TadG